MGDEMSNGKRWLGGGFVSYNHLEAWDFTPIYVTDSQWHHGRFLELFSPPSNFAKCPHITVVITYDGEVAKIYGRPCHFPSASK